MFKKLLTLFILITITMSTYSQNNEYFAKEWQKIDSLPNKEFITNSTLKKIEHLLQEAQKVQNRPYIIKAYDGIIRHKLNPRVRLGQNIDQIYDYIQTLKINHPDITCELIELLEAKLLVNYRAQEYYNIANREVYDSTSTVSKFSIQQLDEKIINLFQRILNSSDLFGKTSVIEYAPILTKPSDPQVTPYLFDAITLDILKNIQEMSEQNLQPSAYRLTDTSVLSNHQKFVGLSLDHIEFTHLKNVFSIYQQLIKHYQNAGNNELLAYIDFHRLKFAYGQLQAPNKSTIYYNSLYQEFKNFPNTRFAAWYGLAMGELFYESGKEYHPFENPAPQFDFVKAAEIYKKIDGYFKETKLTNNYIYQYNDIQTQSADLIVHPHTEPKKPILATLTYKNIQQLKLKVYQLKDWSFENLNQQDQHLPLPASVLKNVVTQKTFTLKTFNDHQNHTTDIILDPLAPGLYYIEYDINNKKTGTILNVSNLTYISYEKNIVVLDKLNSGPVPQATVKLWRKEWDSKNQHYKSILVNKIITDKEGKVNVEGDVYSNYHIEIQKGEDHYIDYNNVYLRSNNVIDRNYKTTKIYLDRAIYRPGQTVFFKGISFGKTNTTEPKTVANENINIEVFDVNDNSVFKKTYTTNELGSISGEFKLPATTLGGSFYIKATNYHGTKYFSVEEYKRPKYKVSFEDNIQAYQLNDSIEVVGNAMAYAGYPIQKAKVSYIVKRVVRLPRWGYFYRPFIRSSESIILTSGIIETDDLGKFKIPFKAIPVNTIDKSFNPIFSYEVFATVTDLSGETHDADHYILLGWNKYDVVFGFDESFDIGKLNQLPISIQNFQGQKQTVDATLTLTGIEPPKGVYHERYNNAGKIDVITVDSVMFKKQFPHELFYREDEQNYWKENGSKYKIDITSNKEGLVDLSKQTIKNGWYKLQLVIPGEKQEPTTYVQFYKGAPTSMYYEIKSERDKPSYNYNEKAVIQFKTNLPVKNQFIYTNYEAVKLKTFGFEKIQPRVVKDIQLANKPQSLTIASILDGRIYTSHQMIYPSNPALRLEVKVVKMKDTLLPGEQAAFEIEVTGNTKNMEVLTGMYDASLDVFAQNFWENPVNREDNLKVGNWNLPYSHINASLQYLNPKIELKEKKIHQFIHFKLLKHLDYYETTNYSLRKMNVSGAPVAEALQGRVQGINVTAADTVSFSTDDDEKSIENKSEEKIRENFNETAFFFPTVKTDQNGKATIRFTIPDALTEWKWMVMAHNTDLGYSYLTDLVVTQKDLMIETNVPRFLRQGDSINYVAKLINVGNKDIKAILNYTVLNQSTNQPISSIFKNDKTIEITIPAKSTQAIDLAGIIPQDLVDEIAITLNVQTDQPGLKDAVKNIIQVLPNSTVLTGARNFYFNGNGKYSFKFPDLKSTLNASTLTHSPVMISMNLNPSWEVINSLPYIAHVRFESSNEYALQIYANALASKIIKDNPGIKENIHLWKKQLEESTPKGTLEDLAFQAISKESSPWLAEAENEKAHKAAIVNLFNESLIKNQIDNALEKLRQLQKLDGGFTWFKDAQYSSTYITTNILILIGELLQWNAIDMDEPMENMVNNALNYLDQSIKTSYRNDSAKYVSESMSRYLYMRNMYKKPIPADIKEYHTAYLNKLYKSWDDLSLYGEAKMGIVALKNNNEALSKRILASLKDRATISDTLGMYWKENTSGYVWSQSQLLVQASLIEFFELMGEDVKTIHQMQKWLLRLKETNRWENAASTANIIKAFFVKNGATFTEKPSVKVDFNKNTFDFTSQETSAGYLKIYKEFSNNEIKKEEVNIQIKNLNPKHMVWGNIMWKYQLPFDQIQPNDNELKIHKSIYYLDNNAWKLVQPQQVLPVGSKVKIVMTITSDRPMEYIHIQDDRAANMEPVNQISGYQFSKRLYYYQTTKDANNHFFIDNLPAGTTEIEYECFINQTGSFFNGVSIIESYYAPNYRNQSNSFKLHSK